MIPNNSLLLFKNISRQIVPSEIITSFGKPSFIENIAIDDKGSIFITSLEEGAVYKISANKTKEKYSQIDGKLAGIVHIRQNEFLCNGWDDQGVPTIYLLNQQRQLVAVNQPAGAMFLNGITRLSNTTFLMCDSYLGVVWKYDLTTNTSEIWADNPLLARADDNSSLPAANGIKIFNNQVFISNTERHLLLTIDLVGDNAGPVKIDLENVNFDDFAIDLDGTIYATTHIYNSVVKISPQKQILLIADESSGVTGSTAIAFGRTPADKNSLYVTTNGGMSLPLPSGLEDANVVKLFLDHHN
ncbi:SMP-30/gluconolactonase/LRE family protein [Dyadobacter arcticus]|uniref:Sugar lactone lactonase YvrE n=1 Tax=Dyadobacter arcticus TaxID=1078754 RepID=A0ABX0UHY7_9BACT|nr:SMP-30/gluconolactonase/LRE family protein [Dyadobacter arcticus]NIJ52639.1 sugar lactone lactonase YvrE [Dyadobacter arcticus]